MDLVLHLKKSLWVPELERDLERFSIRTYLNWLVEHYAEEELMDSDEEFPERFLNYLESEVSSPCC